MPYYKCTHCKAVSYSAAEKDNLIYPLCDMCGKDIEEIPVNMTLHKGCEFTAYKKEDRHEIHN